MTGRRPYHAASLGQLMTAFQSPPPAPSQFNPSVPRELDALISDMIRLDPALRPSSAAEVMDRLGAIAGLVRQEHVLVARAYLSTPTLVGRDASLERFRRKLGGAWTGKGGALLVRGPKGVGRSRFVDACLLEAKLLGALAARADGEDASSGDYGAARALALQLLEASPDHARAAAVPHLDVLATLVPGLNADAASATPGPVTPAIRAALQPALRAWLLELAKERPLVIAVDDVHRVDPPSASLIALLAREAPEHAVVVVASLPSEEDGHGSKGIELLEAHSRKMQLGPLSLGRTERLLSSLFGEIPNIGLAARALHSIGNGLPGDVMQLARHLVDTGLASYDAGAWALSHQLEGAMPADMAQARRARIDALSRVAREIAQAVALATDGAFTFDDCIILAGDADPSAVMRDLDELIRAELLLLSGKDYSLSGHGFREALRASVTEDAARSLHGRLARVYRRRPDQEIRTVEHLFAAGEDTAGLDLLLPFSEISFEQMGSNMEAFARLLFALPDRWLAVFDRALELCDTQKRPPKDRVILLNRVTGVLSQFPVDAERYDAPLFDQLRRDSGLDLWEADAAVTDPRVRLEGALGKAFARHMSPGGGTVYDPKTAITYLGRAVAAAAGSVSSCLDVPLYMMMPSLSSFAPLAPALSAWQTLIDGIGLRITTETERARELYVKQLERLAAPDRAGLDVTYQITQRLGISQVLGTIEAGMGLESALERAALLETSPLHDVNAKRLRMLYHLWQGDLVTAERCRTEAEVLSVEKARRQTNEGAHLPKELSAHALAGDLMRVKRALSSVEPLASRSRGWRPVLHWARAEHERLRGNHGKALLEVERSLELMHPLGHPVWPDAMATHIRILLALDRLDEARARAETYLAEAARRGVGYEQAYIRMPLALVLARLGAHAAAVRECETVFETFEKLGTRGMNVGIAHETRARVALEAGDSVAFDEHTARTREHFRTGESTVLDARVERLVREADRSREAGRADDQNGGSISSEMESLLQVLETCTTRDERLTGALSLLVHHAGAAEGVLLRPQAGHLVVQARIGSCDLPEDVLARAERFWEEECREDDITIVTDGPGGTDGTDWHGEYDRRYHPILLSHRVDGTQALTGMVVLHTTESTQIRHPASLAAHVSRMVLGNEAAVVLSTVSA